MFQEVGFDFKEYLYRYEIMGGTQIYDIYGMPTVFQLFRILPFKLHPIVLFNCYILFFQLVLGYFGSRSVDLFTRFFYETHLDHLSNVLTGLVFAFLPILGLRITHGHINIELITIPMFFVVILGFQYGRFSLLDLILSTVALFAVSPPNGQLMIYVSFFPLFLYLALAVELWKNGNRKALVQGLVFLFLASAGSFLIFFPELFDRINYLRSEDALRSFTSVNLVYSYTTHTWQDLLASFSFILEPFQTRESYFYLHETNYVLGPLVFCLCLLPIRQHKIFFTGLAVMTVMIFGFSMNISPVQDIVLGLNPILKSFRVPARSINIFVIVSFILSISFLANLTKVQELSFRLRQKDNLPFVAGLLFVAALLVVPVWAREILFWALLLSTLMKLPEYQLKHAVQLMVIPALLTTVLSSFKERYRPSELTIARFDQIRTIGEEIRKNNPHLAHPLGRVSVIGNPGAFGFNFPLALSLSSIEGYRIMHKRFLLMVDTAKEQPSNLLQQVVHYAPNEKNYELISDLYNIVATIHVDVDSDKVAVLKRERSPRAAWFVPEILPIEHGQLLSFKDEVYQKGLVLEEKHAHRAGAFPGCEDATVNSIDSRFNDQRLTLTVDTDTSCPLIVSTNYTEKIKAFDKNTGRQLDKFPVWGSLLGIMVPPGIREIELRPEVTFPWFVWHVSTLGWIILILNLLWFTRPLLLPLLPGHRRDRA